MNVNFETGGDGGTATTHDWLTPPEILSALGQFDTDPCASQFQPWRTARVQFTIKDNGLNRPWEGDFCDAHGWVNENSMHSLQKPFASGFSEFQQAARKEKRAEFSMPNLLPREGSDPNSSEATGPSACAERLRCEEATCAVAQRSREKTPQFGDPQPSSEAAIARCAHDMEQGAVEPMPERLAKQVCLLWKEGAPYPRSLYSSEQFTVSGDGAVEHGAGLHELQHQQTESSGNRLVQRSDGHCPHCGLPTYKKSWRVYCNPPYGPHAEKFLKRMSEHGNGITLIFARTETKAFQEYCWKRASGMLFMAGRIKFRLPGGGVAGPAGAPSVLIAYGPENADALRNSGIAGYFVPLYNSASPASLQASFDLEAA